MLIELDQVLDFGAARREAGIAPERSPTIMDPAAFATAHIGLEAIRRRENDDEPDGSRRVRPRPQSTGPVALRSAIAAALRRLAAAIEPQPRERARGT
jgi:hypothetical protein